MRPDNLHRPYIDELTQPNPDDPADGDRRCGIEDVRGQVSTPARSPTRVRQFENEDWFSTRDPGDFIVEYIGRPAAGSPACAGDRTCSTGRPSKPACTGMC